MTAAIIAELDTRDLTLDFTKIAKAHGVTLAELMGHRRFKGMPAARHECWWLLRERGWSYPRIGELFACDHTSIMGGVRKHLAKIAAVMMREVALMPPAATRPAEDTEREAG